MKILGTVLSSAILLGYADSKKWPARRLVRRRRNPTKDIGMLNPTYESAMADVRTEPKALSRNIRAIVLDLIIC